MATQYIEHPQTKERIPFEWNSDTPPTSSDIDGLFQAVSSKSPPDKPVKSAGGFIKNVGSDVVDIGKGIYQIARHPLDTASAIGDLAIGGSTAAQKEMGLLDKYPPSPRESAARRLAAPFVKAVNEPSGIPGQLADYVYEKPVSAAMNLSTGLGLAGKAAEVGGAARVAGALSKASEYTNPATLASRGVSATGAAIADSNIPERIYASAVKMPLSKKWTEVLPGKEISQRKAAAQAGMESNVLPTEFGQAKVALLEKQTRTLVDDIIDVGSYKGDTVKTADIINKGLARAYEKASKSSDPVGAKKIVDDIAEKFLAHGDEIPTKQLQQIKRQLYDEVKWGGAEQTALVGQLQTMGKKGMAHEAMLALEDLYPQVKGLNKQDASFIYLKEGIERAVSRYGNRDLIGLGAKALSVRSIPMAILESTIGHPVVKARLAILLNKADRIPQNPTQMSNAAFQVQQIANQ
jgi:hypothetical protein